MIDIIFNLLIFFLLTPTFQAKEGYLNTNLPKKGPGTPTEERLKIFLEVPADNDEQVVIFFRDDKVPLGGYTDLYDKLRDLRQRGYGEDKPILISPVAEVRHKWVVKAFDYTIWAGFKNIQFTIPR